jgi:hypothetical protein
VARLYVVSRFQISARPNCGVAEILM